MKNAKTLGLIAGVTVFASTLAACGGGGGGGGSLPPVPAGSASSVGVFTSAPIPSPTATLVANPIPSPTATLVANPIPSPTATPTPTPFVATGKVVDDSGNPIVGATVVVSSTLRFIATPPAAGFPVAQAITGVDGSFAVNGLPTRFGGAYVEVFGGAARPVLHAIFTLGSPVSNLGTLQLTTLSAEESAWLNDPVLGINADRARYGVGPLAFDEYLVEAARFWVAYEAANGWYGHACPTTDPACVSTDAFISSRPGAVSGVGQNLDVDAPPNGWAYAEGRIMAEAANCPGGSPIGCPYAENTGHFLNIVNKDGRLVGVAISKNGKPFSGSTQSLNYFVQDFAL